MIWSTLLCRIGRHKLTGWRVIKVTDDFIRQYMAAALAVDGVLPHSERHCKRGCGFSETRPATKRTPAQRRRQLREATGADTTQPKGQP